MKEDLAALLNEAISRLEEAVKALNDNDKKKLYNTVWEAASDIEYATFLIALSRGNANDEWKKKWKVSRDIDIQYNLLTTLDLLRKAVEVLSSDREAAYRNTWFARGHLLNIQNRFNRDRATRSRL